jgi:hypothetical protein
MTAGPDVVLSRRAVGFAGDVCDSGWAFCRWLDVESVLGEEDDGGDGKRDAPPVAVLCGMVGGSGGLCDDCCGLDASGPRAWDVVKCRLDEVRDSVSFV